MMCRTRTAHVFAAVSVLACTCVCASRARLDTPTTRQGADRVDYSALELTGNGHTQDSFSLALQAAARVLGREGDYPAIYCLSSNAFSPAIFPPEDCVAWWHVEGSLAHMALGTACGAIGLKARELPLPSRPADHEKETWARYRADAAPVVRDALDRGEVVLTSGGWRAVQEHGFVPWCYAGIITEVMPDGEMVGACLNGRTDNVCDYPMRGEAWGLSACEPSLSREQTDLRMLHNAVLRIRGEGPYARTEYAAYGLDAMDVWIAKMEQLPFCGPCFESAPDRVWTCALDNSNTTAAGAATAAHYLRERAASLPEAARPHLEQAADCYERIAELLRPSMTEGSGQHCRAFIGNLEGQQAHAADVLRPVRQELAAAADAMEAALLASYPKSALLHDVPAGGHCNSYAGGLAVILNHAGTQADYDTIMGDSGQAFILQSERGRPVIEGAVDVGWWPMASWGLSMRLDFLGHALGRRIRKVNGTIDAYYADAAGHYRDRFELEVKSSIAEGRPLLAEHDTFFIVAGYDAQEPPLLGDWALRDARREPVRIHEHPWGLVVLGDEITPLDRRQADIEALRHALALARDRAGAPPRCFTGRKSYRLWTEALRDTEHLGQARWQSNMCLHLGINRRAASAYVRKMATRHPEEIATHLNAAAALFEQVLEQLSTADISTETMGTQEGRERLAKLVERIAVADRRGFAEIETALAAADGGGPVSAQP